MAEVVKTIKTTGGDYATVALWEAAIPADQPVGDPWVASIEEDMDVGTLAFNVSNVNNAPHRITVASGFRFYQHANWATSMAAIEPVGARAVTASLNPFWVIQCPYVVIEYMSLGGYRGTVNCNNSNGNNVTVRNCAIWPGNTNPADGNAWGIGATASGASMICVNVVAWGLRGIGGFYAASGATTKCYHCTSLGQYGIPPEGYGYAFYCATGGTMECYGCIGLAPNRAAWPFFASQTLSGDENAATDTTAPGTKVWPSLPAPTVVVQPLRDVEDLRLLETAARRTCTDRSGTIAALATDLEGTTRVYWDAGAIEFSTAVGSFDIVLRAPSTDFNVILSADAPPSANFFRNTWGTRRGSRLVRM